MAIGGPVARRTPLIGIRRSELPIAAAGCCSFARADARRRPLSTLCDRVASCLARPIQAHAALSLQGLLRLEIP